MDIQAEKDAIIQRVEQVNDTDLIQAVKSLLDYGLRQHQTSAVAYQADGAPISQQELESRISAAQQEIDQGNYMTIEQLKEESQSW